MDHLTTAVLDALSSRYCPMNKAAFLGSMYALVAAFCFAGIALIFVTRRKADSNAGRALRIAGTLLVIFAIGGAAMDLFGLSGCTGYTAGVTWDRPW